MKVVKVYTLCVILLSGVFYTAQDGNSCFNSDLSKIGNCIPVHDCPSARDHLKLGRIPQNCGFKGQIPLVCCVEETTKAMSSSKSLQMCKQYGAQVKKLLHGVCPAIVQSKPLIVIGRGEKAEDKEFPHMVALGFNQTNSTTEYLCGGTLISKNFVLTAAHCLYALSYGPPETVKLGVLALNSNDNAQPQEIKISKMHKHPNYNTTSRYNDIALLQLEKDVQFSDYAYPACLSTTEEIKDYSKVTVTGWGNTNAWDGKSDTLMKIEINVIPHENCTKFYQPNEGKRFNGIDSKTQICAASLDLRKDACRGDSGGPLHNGINEFCMHNVIGLTSHGKPCLLTDAPGVYTKVFPYLDWIEKIVWP